MKAIVGSLAGVALLSCSPPDFEPFSLVEGVRVLAIAADAPYAAPGQTVTMTSLAVDGRKSPAGTLDLAWFPDVCVNPAGDAYYSCFADFARRFPPHLDLTTRLQHAEAFSFQMPDDVIRRRDTTGTPYGLAVLFGAACAGHLQYEPERASASSDRVPFGCREDSGREVGSDAFVFAYALVYAFQDRENANPSITHLTFGGKAIDPAEGIVVPHCTKSKIDDCPSTDLDVVVPSSDQERDPGDLDASGNPLKEQIYVEYFVTAGKMKADSVTLFDPRRGRLSDTNDEYRPPLAAGEQRLWAVLHDNRGGVSWEELPLHVK